MIVVDASAVLLGLLNDGEARRALTADAIAAPHLVDAEVAQALRSQVSRRRLSSSAARDLLGRWGRFGVVRVAMTGLLDRMWALRHNLSAYDAAYVAAAEALDCPLVTADGRLGRAPGPRCAVTVVPR